MAEKECECGMKVFGQSDKHAEANLVIHKSSRRHKMLMRKKKEREIKNE